MYLPTSAYVLQHNLLQGQMMNTCILVEGGEQGCLKTTSYVLESEVNNKTHQLDLPSFIHSKYVLVILMMINVNYKSDFNKIRLFLSYINLCGQCSLFECICFAKLTVLLCFSSDKGSKAA